MCAFIVKKESYCVWNKEAKFEKKNCCCFFLRAPSLKGKNALGGIGGGVFSVPCSSRASPFHARISLDFLDGAEANLNEIALILFSIRL